MDAESEAVQAGKLHRLPSGEWYVLCKWCQAEARLQWFTEQAEQHAVALRASEARAKAEGARGGAQRSPVQEANLRVDGRLHGALASSGELGGSARPISAAGTPLLQVYAGLFVSAAARARAQSFHAMETTVRLVARRMEHLLELTNTSAAPHDWHSGRLRPLEAKVDGPQVRSQPA